MSEKDIKEASTPEISSMNIFDEFSTDSSLVDEVEKLKEDEKKDVFYYLWLSWKILQNVFFVFFAIAIFCFIYIYIQKSDKFTDKSILDPICFIFTKEWLIPPENTIYCSSITYTKNFYEEKFATIKKEQSEKILQNITRIYEESNFTKTKEVSFLINKTEEKIFFLKVFEKFDILKNEFWWIDKRRVQCSDITIDTLDRTLYMTCSSYSQWYERWLIWFSWLKNMDETGWTSISIANSFLNYIEKNSKDFTLLDKQKVFSSTSVSWEKNGYTNKTVFDIKLKINF